MKEMIVRRSLGHDFYHGRRCKPKLMNLETKERILSRDRESVFESSAMLNPGIVQERWPHSPGSHCEGFAAISASRALNTFGQRAAAEEENRVVDQLPR
jgi:hypothetical protein